VHDFLNYNKDAKDTFSLLIPQFFRKCGRFSCIFLSLLP
jgi:hypothetical protein